jgi:RNA polymerase-binding transcription factor DksA
VTDPSAEQPTTTVDEDPAMPDLDVLEGIEVELADVSRALERLDEGTYGTCEACGAALPDEQLAEAPAARCCSEHQPAPGHYS